MAEAIGLILGILPIFNSVVEDIRLIQIGRDFEGRYGTALVRLGNAELQPFRWAKSISELEYRPESPAQARTIVQAVSTLEQAHSRLEELRKKSASYDSHRRSISAEGKPCMFGAVEHSYTQTFQVLADIN